MTTQDNTNPEELMPVDPNQQAIVAHPVTQTLFRFVSMRNPQLTKKEYNLKFIFRDEAYKEVFDLVAGQWNSDLKISKIDFITNTVKNNPGWFENRIKSEDKILKDYGQSFYDAIKKFATEGYLTVAEIGYVNNVTPEMKLIWNGIIYQVFMQNDFYTKEFLCQMLQTIHYAQHYDYVSTETNDEKKKEKQKELTTATVVIPDYLFIDTTPVTPMPHQEENLIPFSSEIDAFVSQINGDFQMNSLSEVQPYLPSQSDLKHRRVAIAAYEKSNLENLKKELLKIQKQYRISYQKNYDNAYKVYQAEIKPELENYQVQLLEAEAALEEGASKASKDLALKRVAKPEIPNFEFDFENEQDYLRKKLSDNALELLSVVTGGKIETGEATSLEGHQETEFDTQEEEYQTFDEILELLNEKLTETNEQIYQNTEIEKQQYASIGGVLIPVNHGQSAAKTEYKGFAAQTIFRSSTSWSILLTFEDKSIYIADAYENYTANNMVSDNSIIQYSNGVYQLFNGTNLLPISNFKNGFTLNVRFTLSDGKKYAGSVTLTRAGAVTNNTNETGYLVGNSSISLVENTDGTNNDDTGDTGTNDGNTETTQTDTSGVLIPKGFGIKRLGITDYLKVEQTTHAYVEGEVANIENIMAREYRSQSTRRLSRKETAESSSSDTETEKSTDTTSSSRFEMQSEISKILQEATDFGINANTSYSNNTRFGNFSAQLGASYANHRSKEDSMRQAVTQAQEVTARALDRVVTKVHQERIEKIIEEFEENNIHGFDNRKGNQHVIGVYRWVDKLMKNQVWNYGKRLMFEFAVPQPSKLHTLAAASVKNVIDKPVDPRIAKEFTMTNYSALTDENILKYWLSEYSVELENQFVKEINLPFGFSKDNINPGTGDPKTINAYTGMRGFAVTNNDFTIPEGYEVVSVTGAFSGREIGVTWQSQNVMVIIGGKDALNSDGSFGQQNATSGNKLNVDFQSNKPQNKISISVSTWDEMAFAVDINAKCQLTLQSQNAWLQKTFNAIIEAYQDALVEYNNKIAEEDAKASNIKDGNPMFYRQIEQEVLKHNSIAYLVDDSVSKNNKVLGKDLYTGNTVKEFEIKRTGLDDYASLAKFMEQAFEWDIMSYNYYPYYWGKREDWDDMYQSENIDPLFRSFLRSGMARVIVTVRPGFEDAVQFYMSTGRLWNGGEVPVIGDPMYLSLVDEMKDVKGEAQGKPWITRLPTPLTILQAESIGLKVLSALPFTKEDPALFENPEQVIVASNFVKNTAMIESGADKQVAKIGLDEDSIQLTTEDDQVVSELPLKDLKEALE